MEQIDGLSLCVGEAENPASVGNDDDVYQSDENLSTEYIGKVSKGRGRKRVGGKAPRKSPRTKCTQGAAPPECQENSTQVTSGAATRGKKKRVADVPNEGSSKAAKKPKIKRASAKKRPATPRNGKEPNVAADAPTQSPDEEGVDAADRPSDDVAVDLAVPSDVADHSA